LNAFVVYAIFKIFEAPDYRPITSDTKLSIEFPVLCTQAFACLSVIIAHSLMYVINTLGKCCFFTCIKCNHVNPYENTHCEYSELSHTPSESRLTLRLYLLLQRAVSLSRVKIYAATSRPQTAGLFQK